MMQSKRMPRNRRAHLKGLGGVHTQQPSVRPRAEHQHRVQRVRRQRHVVDVHCLARHLVKQRNEKAR